MQVFLSFVYICIAVGDPAIDGRVGIPLTGLTLPYSSACPSQDLEFKRHMSCLFVFSEFS